MNNRRTTKACTTAVYLQAVDSSKIVFNSAIEKTTRRKMMVKFFIAYRLKTIAFIKNSIN